MEVLEVLESTEKASLFIDADPKVLELLLGLPDKYKANLVSGHLLDILCEAAWKASGKKLDWNDSNQWKYWAWWDMRDTAGSAGPGLSFYAYDLALACSIVGSRRVFPSRESLEYAVEQHYQLFVDTLVISDY